MTISILVFFIFSKSFSLSKNLSISKNHKFWQVSLFLTLLIALILNFGQSSGFEIVNWLFYSLPFSVIMRESGKFYALVLAILGLILTRNVSENNLGNWWTNSQSFGESFDGNFSGIFGTGKWEKSGQSSNSSLNLSSNLENQKSENGQIQNRKMGNKNKKKKSFWKFGFRFGFNFGRIWLIIPIVLSSLLTFIPLSQSLNYVKIPKILETANQKCQQKSNSQNQNPNLTNSNSNSNSNQNSQSGKLLLLPYNLYIKPAWSRVFVATPATFYFECSVIIPSFTQVVNAQSGEKTVLQQNSQDLEINQILEELSNEKNPNTMAEKLMQNLKKINVRWLLVDESEVETAKLWAKLQRRTNQIPLEVVQSEQNITLWQVN